jgi:hypothetical protein
MIRIAVRQIPCSAILSTPVGFQTSGFYGCGNGPVVAPAPSLLSMSRVGNPYDNAKAKSFMKTLKHEAVDGCASCLRQGVQFRRSSLFTVAIRRHLRGPSLHQVDRERKHDRRTSFARDIE